MEVVHFRGSDTRKQFYQDHFPRIYLLRSEPVNMGLKWISNDTPHASNIWIELRNVSIIPKWSKFSFDLFVYKWQSLHSWFCPSCVVVILCHYKVIIYDQPSFHTVTTVSTKVGWRNESHVCLGGMYRSWFGTGVCLHVKCTQQCKKPLPNELHPFFFVSHTWECWHFCSEQKWRIPVGWLKCILIRHATWCFVTWSVIKVDNKASADYLQKYQRQRIFLVKHLLSLMVQKIY